MHRPPLELASTVLGAADPVALADFYERLLGWQRRGDAAWTQLVAPDGVRRLSFQPEPSHVAPVWPGAPGDQQMQLHLDFAVRDLAAGVAWAVDCGARIADHQPQDDVRVLLDPAGHPFCLFAHEDVS